MYVVVRMILMFFIVDIILGYLVHTFYPLHAQVHNEHAVESKIVTVTMIALIFFLYEGIYYFNRSRLVEIKNEKLEKITAEQKLDTLKNQVNPHFLFNSLNTVITMIPEEPDLAINFIQKLSKTYRNILEVRNEKLIPLRQEMQALDSYIYLLKTRFQGKIHIFNTLTEDKMNHFILPLSLQILIENAVKHNVVSSAKPLKIELFAEDNYIVVRNNLQKKDQKYNSTKLGLANIKSRYNLLINKEIEVIETEEYFTVKLPIILNQLNAHTDN